MDYLFYALVSGIIALSFHYPVKPYEYRPEEFIRENGETAYSIECYYRKNICFQRAFRQCPKGFDIITSSFTPVASSVKATSVLNPPDSIFTRYNLEVACNESTETEMTEPLIEEYIKQHLPEL